MSITPFHPKVDYFFTVECPCCGVLIRQETQILQTVTAKEITNVK